MSMGARRRNGRVGNVDNVNDMNEVVQYMRGPMECWVQLAAYIVKSVGAGGTDREVLTAGFIPDGMNYVKVKDMMTLARTTFLHLHLCGLRKRSRRVEKPTLTGGRTTQRSS